MNEEKANEFINALNENLGGSKKPKGELKDLFSMVASAATAALEHGITCRPFIALHAMIDDIVEADGKKIFRSPSNRVFAVRDAKMHTLIDKYGDLDTREDFVRLEVMSSLIADLDGRIDRALDGMDTRED